MTIKEQERIKKNSYFSQKRLANSERHPQLPQLYEVILHNNDLTPMNFVVELLQDIFQKQEDIAYRLMLEVHYSGSCICGIYPNDIAETKSLQVEQQGRVKNYPLQCSLKKHRGDKQ
jgi:ATP-dependent Clp protease adaptor protein ClpS